VADRYAGSLGELGDRTIRKVSRRIMPLVVWLYFIAYLDRNNVGFAKLDMSDDLGLSATAFGLGAGIFFIGYGIFEIPSNAAMHRFGARKWIARILITWGLFASAMALVQNETSFYILRFLLGASEAGFFPAIVLYLTYWFPAAQRVSMLGIFILAQPLANAIGAPVSGLLLAMDGILGLHGWQWLFIIEGIPAVLMGLLVPRIMTDHPPDARWLAEDERRWLTQTMEAEHAAKAAVGEHSFIAGLKDRRALVFAALYFGLVFGIYGLGLWLPTVVDELGDLSSTQVGAIVFVPYTIAAVFVYFWSRHSDRTGERVGHTSFSMLLAAVGLVGSGYLLDVSPVLGMAAITVAAMGIYSAIAPFWELPAAALTGAAAASGIAMVNSLGNLAGFLSPFAVGVLTDRTGDTRSGLLLLAAVLFLTSVATFLYGRRIGAGRVPSVEPTHRLAREAAALDLPAEELHHSHDEDIVPGGRPRDGGAV
jgi:ACS family tartrate transporter-like MFS transporter